MNRLTVILLLLFISTTGMPRAQSGRRQSDKGSNSASGRPQPSDHTTRNSSVEDGKPNQGAEQGEVIEGDVLRVNTSLVTVPVSVLDRNGKYIPDLGREDFHIFEEGVEQQVAYFATVDQPFSVALVLDISGSTDYHLDEIQEAAIAFVNQLKPLDALIYPVAYDTGNNGSLGGGGQQRIPLPGGRGGVILGIPFPRSHVPGTGGGRGSGGSPPQG